MMSDKLGLLAIRSGENRSQKCHRDFKTIGGWQLEGWIVQRDLPLAEIRSNPSLGRKVITGGNTAGEHCNCKLSEK